MDIIVSTPPASDSLPESLAVLKKALRIEHTADDDYLTELLKAAADQLTTLTGRQVLTCTRRLGLPRWWFGSLDIPYPKLQSVGSIEYLDRDGTTQILDPSRYSVFTSGLYGRIVIKQTMPELFPYSDARIAIFFDCGYGTTGDDVPAGLKLPVREIVRGWYEENVPKNRFPSHVDAMLDVWKLKRDWQFGNKNDRGYISGPITATL